MDDGCVSFWLVTFPIMCIYMLLIGSVVVHLEKIALHTETTAKAMEFFAKGGTTVSKLMNNEHVSYSSSLSPGDNKTANSLSPSASRRDK